jgi:hypothetical protein|tara:strand:- start:970 stop:1575 length:606 start_codon:yes stop_codon:yes gene_type:complete
MKTVEEADMQQVEQEDVKEFIDRYLTEEDKDRLCSGSMSNDVKLFPGNETFFLNSEAKRVKEFIECGHYVNVIGFGIDYLMGRNFSYDWTEFCDLEEVDQHLKDILVDFSNEGHVFEDDELDKIYAWTQISAHNAMSITVPIMKKLQDISRMLWASCVIRSKVFAEETNDVANSMMKNIINKWSETVIIPHRGIGRRNLME